MKKYPPRQHNKRNRISKKGWPKELMHANGIRVEPEVLHVRKTPDRKRKLTSKN